MGFSLDSNKVEANVFNEFGKWKYTVCLDYDFPGFDYNDWNIWEQARKALANATLKHVSGVTFTDVYPGWTMVVLEPYAKTGHPIMVKHERVGE